MKSNRLAHEKSPYLLQHADNPVDWYPWGEEAFEARRAREQADLPVDRLLHLPLVPRHGARVVRGSGGRRADERGLRLHQGRPRGAAGHRPDLHDRLPDDDRQRRLAADHRHDPRPQALLRRDLLPEGEPVRAARDGRAGPARRSGSGRPNATGWSNRRGRSPGTSRPPPAATAAAECRRTLATARPSTSSPAASTPSTAASATARSSPRRTTCLFLLQHWRGPASRRRSTMVEKTLDAMRRGGIYDQLGFGFHRYSTDDAWLVPHFEKMLYDQALLALAYTEAFPATGKPAYRRTAGEIFAYVLRDLTSPEGGLLLGRGRRQRRRGGPLLPLDRAADPVAPGRPAGGPGHPRLERRGQGNFRDEASGARQRLEHPPPA